MEALSEILPSLAHGHYLRILVGDLNTMKHHFIDADPSLGDEMRSLVLSLRSPCKRLFILYAINTCERVLARFSNGRSHPGELTLLLNNLDRLHRDH